MYQNYVDNNLKPLGVVDTSSRTYQASTVYPSTLNVLSYVGGGNGSTGRAAAMVLDTQFDNVLLSVEMRLTAFDPAQRYFPFVLTYVSQSQASSHTLAGNSRVLLPTLGDSTDYFVDARVIIPRLPREDSQTQYVVVGYASESPSNEFTELCVQARAHVFDLQCAQPSK